MNLIGSELVSVVGLDRFGRPSAATEQTTTGAIAALASSAVSVKDYGATGSGTTDDTAAIQAALNANPEVFFPAGTYLTTSTLTINSNQTLTGVGPQSIVQATGSSYDVFQVIGSYNTINNLKTQNGLAGFRLFGKTAPCVQNSMYDVGIWGAQYGLVLDGYQSLSNPCYWNNFYRVLVAQPAIDGILLTKSGSGDTPNANTFHSCRVYSLGVNTTGDGLYVQYGGYRNSFVDFEANVATTANSCIHIGANANDTRLINPYTDTQTAGTVTNILLDSGSGSSAKTIIAYQTAEAGGAAIVDNSGGNWVGYNAPSTTNGQQHYMEGLNIGYPINVVANTLNAPFQIHGLNSNTANSSVFAYLNNNVGARISLNKCRSTTLGNNGLVLNNDQVGYLDFNGNDNSHWLATASVWGVVDGTVTAGGGIVPGRVQIMTQPTGGGGLLEGLRVDSSQNTTVQQGLTVVGTTTAATINASTINASGEMKSTFGGSSSTATAALGVAASGSTAANFYCIGVEKSGTDEFYFGINKNSTTNNIPASACFITSYLANSNITIGRGNGAGQPNKQDIAITGAGSVLVGTPSVATNATDGFLYIPSNAGAPTGTPTAQSGQVPMYYDSTNHKFWIYDGGWKGTVLS